MPFPRQPFRGFMLDTARNYFPVDVIKRQLDAMSWVKARSTHLLFVAGCLPGLQQLGTFHWHIVDSQSFPLVIPGYEKISSTGAYSSDEVYTSSQIADIVQYANEVGNLPRFPFLDLCSVLISAQSFSAVSTSLPRSTPPVTLQSSLRPSLNTSRAPKPVRGRRTLTSLPLGSFVLPLPTPSNSLLIC